MLQLVNKVARERERERETNRKGKEKREREREELGRDHENTRNLILVRTCEWDDGKH